MFDSKKEAYLRGLFEERIIIGSTDGTQTINSASEVFAGGIDFNVNLELNASSQPTGTSRVIVPELVKDGTFRNIFESVDYPLDRLCLTQHQIVDFCVTHRNRLRQGGYGTFFLFKRDETLLVADDISNLLVADVRVGVDGSLFIFILFFLGSSPWYAICRHRFVLPLLAV